MKKSISIIISLCLIFASVVPCFASATSWDTTDQANLSSIKNALTTGTSSIFGLVTNIKNYLYTNNKSVAQLVDIIKDDIESALFLADGSTSRSITWWIKEAVLDLDNIVNDTTSGSLLYYISNSFTRLGYINNNASAINTTTGYINTHTSNIDNKLGLIRPDVETIKSITTSNLPVIATATNDIDTLLSTTLSMNWDSWTSTLVNNNNVNSFTRTDNPINQILNGIQFLDRTTIYGFTKMFYQAYTGYNSSQNAVNWGNLGTSTFTPSSQTDGVYKWLSAIQAPIARLSYVHASDDEIEAREKAAANQAAVVDDFIDSNGSASVSASDLGDMASLSSGFESNFNTGVSASNVWSVFGNDRTSWFSNDTKNQLDTTPQTRGSSEYPTPLLDEYYNEILALFDGDR